MSYTHADVVRQHLAPVEAAGEAVHDQAVVIPSGGTVRFFSGAVDADSVVVKSIRNDTRLKQQLLLSSQQVPVVSGPIVPGTVVVASDSSLGKVYTENRDYVVSYASGTLSVKPDGELSVGMTVSLWCHPYTLYEQGVDYSLDEDRAQLTSLTSGNMSAGEMVWVDYRPVFGGYNDELVNQAVTEANATVATEVDPDREFGTEPLLQAAATYRALAVVARSTASRHLGSGRGSYRDADTWLRLAEQYASRADELLRSFRPPYDNPARPRHS
jgi:hypothetical protein